MKALPQDVTIIAEIGNTHEGSIGLAKQFVKSAAACGVDGVKFQTHIFENESLPDAPNPPYFKDESRKAYFKRTSFSLNQWKEIKRFAEEECGVEFLSSPFSLEAVDLLESVGVQTYKIPSGEVSNLPLLIKIARTFKRVLLSSGMSNWNELDEAVKTLTENGCRDLVILQCTSEYPCPPEHAGLNVIREIKTKYGLPVGFSDHTLGIGIAIAAICMGACLIEKHFVLTREMYGPDAKFSVTPAEMKELVTGIRDAERAIRTVLKKDEITPSIEKMKIIFEKSIVLACDIKAGTRLEPFHLAFKKPGDGISAKLFEQVLGKCAVKDIPVNTKLTWGMLEISD